MIIGAIENHWTTRDLRASRGRNRRRCHLSFSRKAEKQQQPNGRQSRAEQSSIGGFSRVEQQSRAEGGGGEADADAGGQVALVVPGERARDVDGLVAVPAEERPVLHAKDERRFLLADVAAREPGGERLEREALVLAGELVGGVDLDVAARAQRSFVGTAHHRGSRALARVEQSRAEQQRMREGRELRGR